MLKACTKMVSNMCCMDLPSAKMMFYWKAERSVSSVTTYSVFCDDLPLLIVSVNKDMMGSCVSLWLY